MEYTIEEVRNYIESLGHYKKVTFVEEQKGDCIYFDAINTDGVDVSIRADVEDEVSMKEWSFYECCDKYDWNNVREIYQ
ncbi:hypothetical protein AAGG74_15755 [Bacillus mexicanus]|uniref:hypothetical protein n=1 Tax=Bacillus mexicanus TaxID=2834415 RepID=UPI003D1E6806